MKLRPYQNKIIEKIRNIFQAGKKKVVMCAPTGSGKTVMFTYMVAKHLEKGGRVLVFTHRKELLQQAGSTFEAFGLEPNFIDAGSTPDLFANLHVGMIETFNRRITDLELFLQQKTMIIIDECHINNFTKIFEYINKNTFVIGATATPYRKGKSVPALDEFYEDIVSEVQVQELVDLKYLAVPKTYGVKIDLSKAILKGDDYDTSQLYSETKLYVGVFENYLKIGKSKKTLIFASNVKNSIEVCSEFNKYGVKAKHIDGTTPKKIRSEVLDWFENTPDAVLCNCGILTAGYDHSEVETIILYRATTSLPLFLQMCGRGSRVSETKKTFNILDFGNNVRRLGFWEDFREWSIKKVEARTTKEDAIPVKDCPKCHAMLPQAIKECLYCQWVFPKTKKDVEDEQFAELQLLTKKEVNNLVWSKNVETWVKLVKAKKMNPFRPFHVLKSEDIEIAKQYIDALGWKRGFMYVNRNKYDVFREL